MRYKVFNYMDDKRKWEHFWIVGEIECYGRRFFVVDDDTTKERYIRELIATSAGNDGLKAGNILASIDDDALWWNLVRIAQAEGIVNK